MKLVDCTFKNKEKNKIQKMFGLGAQYLMKIAVLKLVLVQHKRKTVHHLNC